VLTIGNRKYLDPVWGKPFIFLGYGIVVAINHFFFRVFCILLQLDMEYSSQFHYRNQRSKNFRKRTSKKKGGQKKKKNTFL
jgi:hypothetical protein